MCADQRVAVQLQFHWTKEPQVFHSSSDTLNFICIARESFPSEPISKIARYDALGTLVFYKTSSSATSIASTRFGLEAALSLLYAAVFFERHGCVGMRSSVGGNFDLSPHQFVFPI
jgi:hypothetical protein